MNLGCTVMSQTGVTRTPSQKARTWSSLLMLAALFGAVGVLPLQADRITLTNGKTLEGKIITDGDPLILELPAGGVVKLVRSRIGHVEKGPSPGEELARREAALPPGDTEATYRLAEWCREHGLRPEGVRLAWRVLEIDPHHAAARRELGHRKLGALWLTEEDYHGLKGQVRYEGRWISKKEWRAAQERTHTEHALAGAEDLFRTAAGEGETATRRDALEGLDNLDARLRNWALLKGTESLKWRERQFAVRELGRANERRHLRLLAHMAVTDRKRSVRDEALRTLKQWDDPETALSFIPYLGADHDSYRVNAVRALNVFPDRRAAGPMITTLSKVWSGFGRVHFASLTQRAYVKDYELVSGGTGLVVQEVADPVVDTFMSGVVLDIQIRRVEAVARVAALTKITGQKFGMNFEKWEEWWAQQTGSKAPKTNI